MRLNRSLADPKTQKENLQIFFKVIAGLKNTKEVRQFFEEFLTPAERRMLSQRIGIARLLFQGKSYGEIANKLKVSHSTIGRVNRWLKYGAGGYRLVLRHLLKG